MTQYTILYDGWPLVRQPNGPAANHLLALLAHLPSEIRPVIALPESPPPWLTVETSLHPTPNTSLALLFWQQRVLPRLSAKVGADLLHTTTATAPLLSQVKTVVSPAGLGNRIPQQQGLITRLRISLAQGGMARAGAVLWPNDVPPPQTPAHLITLPPIVHPDYTPLEPDQAPQIPNIGLPETYVLYYGPADRRTLSMVLQSWSWAAKSIGELYPLLLLGLGDPAKAITSQLVAHYAIPRQSVQAVPPIAPPQLPRIYQGCAALFHPAPIAPWGDPVRHALACARPIVALDNASTAALVREAAYLVPEEDARSQGAALITVLVEDAISQKLSTAAKQRAASWDVQSFADKLFHTYQQAIKL